MAARVAKTLRFHQQEPPRDRPTGPTKAGLDRGALLPIGKPEQIRVSVRRACSVRYAHHQHRAGAVSRVNMSNHHNGPALFSMAVQGRTIVQPIDFPLPNLPIPGHRAFFSVRGSKARLSCQSPRVCFRCLQEPLRVAKKLTVKRRERLLFRWLPHVYPPNRKTADAVPTN